MTLTLPLQDLMADLKSEISGDLARLILGLMMPPAHYDAKQLKKAMEVPCTDERTGWGGILVLGIRTGADMSSVWTPQGAGTDEKALIEILATRTNAEIRAINEAYKEGECVRVAGPYFMSYNSCVHARACRSKDNLWESAPSKTRGFQESNQCHQGLAVSTLPCRAISLATLCFLRQSLLLA